ncbi:MAG: hypothetical protein U1F35_21390 [Steroidobacteraceae bacterium]
MPSPSARRWPPAGQLILFVSSTCPICKKLIPIAKGFAKSDSVLFVGDADPVEQRRLIAQFDLDERRFINGPEVGMAYRVDKLPYAVLLDEGGRAQLMLFVSSTCPICKKLIPIAKGFATIQSYLKSRTETA